MNELIEAARKKISVAREEYDIVVRDVQSACEHPQDQCVQSESTRKTYTIGCGYGSSSTGTPPFKVCKLCGYAECDWYAPAPRKLRDYELVDISYDEAIKFVIGGIRSQC